MAIGNLHLVVEKNVHFIVKINKKYNTPKIYGDRIKALRDLENQPAYCLLKHGTIQRIRIDNSVIKRISVYHILMI